MKGSISEYVLTLPDDALIVLAKTDWGTLEMICGLLSVELNIGKNSRDIN